MPAKETPGLIRYRTEKAQTRNRLNLLGLLYASSKAASVPNIDLSRERMLKMKMRKSTGKDGKLVNLSLSTNHPVHPCAPAKSSAHSYTQNCVRIRAQ